MNTEAFNSVALRYSGVVAGVDIPSGLYALAGVESNLDPGVGGIAEPDGTTSYGPWQINDASWPFLPAPPTDTPSWASWAAWMGPVVASLAVGLRELSALPFPGGDTPWRWLPYYWRHGRAATLARARRVKSLSVESWISAPIDRTRELSYDRFYSEAFAGSSSPTLSPHLTPQLLQQAADGSGGWLLLGLLVAAAMEGG